MSNPYPSITCCQQPAPAEFFAHDDGTHRWSWKCGVCGLGVAAKSDRCDAVVARIVAAGIDPIPLYLLTHAFSENLR